MELPVVKRCSNSDCQNPAKNEAGYLLATTLYFKKHSRCLYGVHSRCKFCKRQQDKNYIRKNYVNLQKQWKKYREKNKEKIRQSKRKCYLKRHKYYLEETKRWQRENKERRTLTRKIYEKKRRKEDVLFRLLLNLRRRVRIAIKTNSKGAKTKSLIGCSVSELKQHLESKFQEGMTWENYGIKGWHIDHIKPCSSFDFSKIDQQQECFHYSNMQPLWAKDNLRKGSKYVE